ncbi:MAG TPA: DUF805 domain-containing protein [Pseudolabrys sp.]|nr:DUF805 domain-containing protein [Pseudolabrys sp.]
MEFGAAVVSVFSKYAIFSGRAPRSEYWWFILFYMIVSVVAEIGDKMGLSFGLLGAIWTFATLIPTIAVSTRRLHDIDRSGWWQLIAFIPIVGWIILIIWFTRVGTNGANRFGPDPFAGAAGAPAAPAQA